MSVSIGNIIQPLYSNEVSVEVSVTVTNRQASWSLYLFRYATADESDPPVVTPLSIGSEYAGDVFLMVYMNTTLVAGNNYLRAKLMAPNPGGMSNVIAASALDGPTIGYSTPTFSFSHVESGSIVGTVNVSSELGSTVDGRYVGLRVVDSAGAAILDSNGNPIVAAESLATGENSKAFTLTGLTNGQEYFLRPFVDIPNAGTTATINGDTTGPYTPRVPVSVILTDTTLDNTITVTVSRSQFPPASRAQSWTVRVFAYPTVNPTPGTEISSNTAIMDPDTDDVPVTVGNLPYDTNVYLVSFLEYEGSAFGGSSFYGPLMLLPASSEFDTVRLGDGTITATVSRIAFADRSASWYGELRAFTSADGSGTPISNGVQFAAGAETVVVTLSGLTNGTQYYLRSSVFDGSLSTGASAIEGPFVPAIPAADVTVVYSIISNSLVLGVSRAAYANLTNEWAAVVSVFTDALGTNPVMVNGEPLKVPQQYAAGSVSASVTVTGLTNGTSYYLAAFIRDSTGEEFGYTSIRGPYIPAARPVVTSVNASSSVKRVTVSWTYDTGGSHPSIVVITQPNGTPITSSRQQLTGTSATFTFGTASLPYGTYKAMASHFIQGVPPAPASTVSTFTVTIPLFETAPTLSALTLSSIEPIEFAYISATQLEGLASANMISDMTAEQIRNLASTAVSAVNSTTFDTIINKTLTVDTEDTKPVVASILTKASTTNLSSFASSLSSNEKTSITSTFSAALVGFVAAPPIGSSKNDVDKLISAFGAVAQPGDKAPVVVASDPALLGTPVLGTAGSIVGKSVALIPTGSTGLVVDSTTEALKIAGSCTFTYGSTPVVVEMVGGNLTIGGQTVSTSAPAIIPIANTLFVVTGTGSVILTQAPRMDIMRIDTAYTVKIRALLNNGAQDYSSVSVKLQVLKLNLTSGQYEQLGYIADVPIPAAGTKYVDCEFFPFNTTDDYKFVAWLQDSQGAQGIKSASRIDKWSANSAGVPLDITAVTASNNSLIVTFTPPQVDAGGVLSLTNALNGAGVCSANAHFSNTVSGTTHAQVINSNGTYTGTIAFDGLLAGTLYDLVINYGGRFYYVRAKTTGTPYIFIDDQAQVSPNSYGYTFGPSDTDMLSPTYTANVSASNSSVSLPFTLTKTTIYHLADYTFTSLIPGTQYQAVIRSTGYTDLVTSFSTSAPSTAICFLADAPVLTPAGYRPISSIAVGDLVRTAAGRTVTVKRVFAKEYTAGPAVNPFVIPKGMFGALRSLPISPNHEVMTAKGMVKAKNLGLKRMKMAGDFTYYNLELDDWVRDNLVVAGVECESLAPAARITLTKAEFGRFVRTRYGPAAAARLRLSTVCFEEADGRISLPSL